MDKLTLLTASMDYDKARYTVLHGIKYNSGEMLIAVDINEPHSFAYYYDRLKETVSNAYSYKLISDEETLTILDKFYLTKDRNQFIKDFQINTDEINIFTKLEQRIFIKDNDLFNTLQKQKKIDIQVYDYEFDEPYFDAKLIKESNTETKFDTIIKTLDRVNKDTERNNQIIENLIDSLDHNSETPKPEQKPIPNNPISEKQEMDLVKIFSETTVDENSVLHLPNYQFDRKTYTEIKKQIEAIGGKWKGGKTQGFIFAETTDTSKVREMLVSGVDLAERKKKYQFFGTPSEVADTILQYLPKECTETGYIYIRDTDKVLEPSAGQGSIIKAIHRINPNVVVDCFEMMEENKEVLKTLPNVNILGDNFLESDTSIKYDLIVANPPFANNQDIDHVVRMYEHLKPSGTLISIMSPHFIMASDKKSRAFRYFINNETAETHYLDEGAFIESGTSIRTAFVIINKEAFADNFDFEEIQKKVTKDKINDKLNNDEDLRRQLQEQYEQNKKKRNG